MNNNATAWWGTFQFQEKQALFWEIGPLLLGIERFSEEWRIASNSSESREKMDIKVAMTDIAKFLRDNLQFRRHVFKHTDASITLTPMLADRPQVTRAEVPFYLPPGEQVTIYVSSPVWVHIEANDNKVAIDEIPTLRLSDTWYGPNTREGELCYSSSTFCRTNLNELTVRPHRIISPVIIQNNAKHPLLLDRVSLPMPYLSVFADENNNLWTEEIIVKNEPHHKHTVRHGKGAPSIAPLATLIGPPRLNLKTSNLITLFYSLLTE
ncbi:MAG: DUF432 domain-containing protein [Gammaproteobacteria bacterium]|nr:DUF432 domain-containing protein [Gammaproteobacteria bacterium]